MPEQGEHRRYQRDRDDHGDNDGNGRPDAHIGQEWYAHDEQTEQCNHHGGPGKQTLLSRPSPRPPRLIRAAPFQRRVASGAVR